MRKSSWVWLLCFAMLFSMAGLALAEEKKAEEQPVKVEDSHYRFLWLGGTPLHPATTQLDEFTYYLQETFDDGIPADWDVIDNTAGGAVWAQLTSVNGTGHAPFVDETPPFAGVDSDAAGSGNTQDTDLITSVITIPAATETYFELGVKFDLSFRSSYADMGSFSYSIDAGATWIEFASFTSTNYNSQEFDLLPILGQTGGDIQFKWHYEAGYDWHMAIDNIEIFSNNEDLRGPIITILDAPADVLVGFNADFLVVVSDPSGVATADLQYHQWDAVNSELMVGGYNGTIALTTVNGDTMSATIDGSAVGYAEDDIVAFWFEATDATTEANASRLPEVTTSYYGFEVVIDEEAPEVEILTLPPFTFLGEDGIFEFEITDELTDVGYATLHYAEFDTTEANYGPVAGGVAGSVDMMPGTDGFFTATVPGADFVVGDFVGYWLEVSDTWTPANTDTLPSATDGQPDYMLYEVLADADLLWDFEADQGDLVGSGDLWEWGNPTGAESEDGPALDAAYSGDNVWATNLLGDYPNSADNYLTTTVAWALDADARLRFVQWYYTETYDGHNVQISTDLGETWTVIEPIEGYTDNIVYGMDSQPAYNGYSHNYWHLASFDLSAYEGEMVMFRIRFDSDSSVPYYGAAIDDFMLWGALVPGELDGTVTDASDAPVEGASVTLYLHNTDVEVDRTVTDDDGYYHMYPLPGNYDVVARQYGFLNAEADSVDVFEETLTTADIQMTSGAETDTLRGTVWGDMDMTTPLEGVVVSIPDEGFGAFTPAEGTFDFGEVDHGEYDIVLTSVPTGYMGYHDVYLFDYEVTDRTLPLDLFMPEILAPMNVNATTGDGEVLLIWEAPDDFFTEEEFEAMPAVLEEMRAQYDIVMAEGTEAEQAKLPTIREEIFRMEQALLRHNNTQLDQISDFAGYYVMLNGEIWNEEPIEDTEVLIDGLRNGLEYEIMVAADYGYHENYLVWSEPLNIRPLPAPDYLWEEITYDWFEINPANGGPGTVWIDVDDDVNTGLEPLGFDFTFYGSVYNELAACTNGWLSFTDGTTTFGLTIVFPSTTLPNAVLAPLNEDMDTEVAGDGLAIWKYYDTTSGLFYVQYNTKYWFDETDVYTFQMILDPSDNTITYQYNTATNGWNANTATAGIENADGTQAVSIPGSEIYDGMAVKFFMEGGERGNFEGMITDVASDDPIAGAVVKAVSASDHAYTTSSDEDGEYQLLLLNRDDGPYTVTVRAEGYEDLVVADVDWDETDDFVHYVDFALTELSPDSPPRVVSVNGNFDDRFEVVLGAPGSLLETEYLVMDDGTMAGVYAWTSAPTPDQLAGTGFNVAGNNVTLLSAEVHCGIDYSAGDAWPDDTHEPVVFNILADDDGMPGEILWTSEPVDVDAATEWATVTIGIPVPNNFYIMMSNPNGAVGQEGISVDSANDHANYWYNAGSGWNHLTTASGDPLMRATVQYVPGGGEGTEEAVLDPSRLASGKDNANTIINNSMHTDVYGLHGVRNVTRPRIELPASTTSLDAVGDVLWYMLDYSADGETWTHVEVDGDTLIDPASPVIQVVLGSENENTEYQFRASTWMTDPDGAVDSLRSLYATGVATFNMMPSAPEGFGVDVDGTSITLTVTPPTTNADGTDLVDLTQYKAWEVTEEGLVELGVSTTEEITFTVAETGLYTITVTAEDEVPNVSGIAMPITVMAGDPGVETSFEEGEWNAMVGNGVWEHGAPVDVPEGPDAAFEGDNVWATIVAGDYGTNNADDWLYSIEPLNVLSADALFIYYHWVDYEGGWDGYQLKVSTDEGASWVLVEPVGGYPVAEVEGLGDEPGFSGSTGGWQMVMVPLGDFVGQNLTIGFHHGTDSSVNDYYGVALDNFAMYDIQPPVYGSITGSVKECDGDGIGVGGVEIWAEGWPVPLGVTENDGSFDVPCPVGTWDILFVHDDYWTEIAEDVVVTEGTATTITETYMTYPEGVATPTSLEMVYYVNVPDAEPTIGNFDVENTGCGPMEYAVSIQVLDGITNETPGGELPTQRTSVPEALTLRSESAIGPIVSVNLDEPWDLITSYDDLETGTGAQDNFGFAMGANNFYVGGFYYGTLTTFDYDGTYIDQIAIDGSMEGSSLTGLFGLSNDPNGYLYGGNVDGNIFKFTPDMSEIESQGSMPLRAISLAYDFDNNVFYTSDFSNGFYSLTPNGTAQTIALPTSGAIYGLAYVPMDPDGYTIYAHVETNPTSIIRYNPSTNAWDETPVATVYTLVESENGDSCGDMAAGMRGETYDFLTAMQGGADGAGVDLADLWEGYTLQQWITVDPVEGTILPGATQQFTISVDPSADENFNPEEGTTTEVFITLSGPHMDDFGVYVTISWELGADEESQLPTEYALHQNYPNPFNPSTSIKFALVDAQQVKLTVYNMLGQEVTRLVNTRMEAGYHTINFDASHLASGVYFYRLETPVYTNMKKMVMIK